MGKIEYEKLQKMLMDITIPDSVLRDYLTVDPEYKGTFNPRIVTDPTKVNISVDQQELESAMGLGNGFCRWRRQSAFKRAINRDDDRPVIVSEGDSWWQFPFLIDDTIDHLGSDYLIWSLGAAGDTAKNMTGSNAEYMQGLIKWKEKVKGFLFSAAGNDVLGEDASGKPVLLNLLKHYKIGADPAWHVNREKFDETLDLLRDSYRKVINTIRENIRFKALPIFIHGYDYVFPYPYGDNDKRDPLWAANNQWLGGPMDIKGYDIAGHQFRREVIKVLVDALYNMLAQVAAEDPAGQVHVVDCRGAMPDPSDWADEIHGTDDGFKKVADRFRTVMQRVIK